MNAKLISVTVAAEVFGQLWMGGEASKDVSRIIPVQAWDGSLRRAFIGLKQVNDGGDFQRGSVRLECPRVRLCYRRGKVQHAVWVSAPDSVTFNA